MHRFIYVLYFAIFLTPSRIYAQQQTKSSTEGLISRAVNTGTKALNKPLKKWYSQWRYKKQPYHISPYDGKIYSDCLKKTSSNCRRDTFSYRGLNVNFGFTGAIGFSQFARAIQKGAYGFFVRLEFQPTGKAPISMGLNITTLIGGIQNSKADLNFAVSNNGNNLGVFPVPTKVNIKNSYLNINGVTTLWVPVKFVQPYFQASFGFLSSGTNMKFYRPDEAVLLGISNDGLIFEQGILSSVNWCAGGAFGLWINISRGVNIDLRTSYLHSGSITFYTNEQIKDWQFFYEGNSTDLYDSGLRRDKIVQSSTFGILNAPMQILTTTIVSPF